MTTWAVRTEQERGENMFYPVIGSETEFEISSDGVVRSLSRLVNSPVAGGERMHRGRVMKHLIVKGYPAIQSSRNGIRKTIYVHRMIAELFIPRIQGKDCVNHKDGNKENFKIDNLEWCTHLENMQHAYRTGLAKAPIIGPGEKCPASKLNDKKVSDIKSMLLSGKTHLSIAKIYGVSKGCIGYISRGETWSHVRVN